MPTLKSAPLLGWVCLVASACTSSDSSSSPEGVVIDVRYDSLLDVDRIEVWTAGPNVTAPERVSVVPPLFVDPPGLRSVQAVLSPEAVSNATMIQAEGFDGGERLIGRGLVTVTSSAGPITSVLMTLLPPGFCGDGLIQVGAETCDDGNSVSGDGCASTCGVELDWSCEGEPSRCGLCGDGTEEGPEECDDGNLLDNDGCSSECRSEIVPPPPPMGTPSIEQVELAQPQTTLSAEFEDVPDVNLTVPPTGDTWLVFASGALGSSSTDELSAEARLMVGDQTVAEFGHQTTGDTDNHAGFVAFDIVEPDAPRDVSLQFRAIAGETSMRDIRLVAARLPQGAMPQSISVDSLEATGMNVSLTELRFENPTPGDWIIMAQTSLTENPGDNTAQVWLVDAAGNRRPLDDRGASVSAPRGAWVPFFTMARQTLDAGPVRFAIQGTSSGTDDTDDWWRRAYLYRHRLTIEAQDAVSSGYAVPVTFDHARLVQAGFSQADGRDIRAIRFDGTDHRQLDRVLDPDSAWNQTDTTVWIPLDADIAAQGSDADYFLYFGREDAPDPLADPAVVFTLYDDFEAATPDPTRWPVIVGAEVQNGAFVLPNGARIRSELHGAAGASMRWEARVQLEDPETRPIDILGVYFEGLNGLERFARLTREADADWARSLVDNTSVTLDALARSHRYSIDATAAGFGFWQDDTSLAVHAMPASPPAPTAVRFENQSARSFQVDWVRVRPVVANEPRVVVGDVKGFEGLVSSRWRHLRLVAFRADAFDRVETARVPERSETNLDEPLTLVSLTVPGLTTEADHLVLQTVRVSGASNGSARRSGMLILNGTSVLTTSHKITRDSTPINGYHHTAGAVYGLRTAAPFQLSNAIRSLDGINVDGAEASIIVLGYPPR